MAPIPSPTSNRLPLPDLHLQQIHPAAAAAQFGHPAAADHDDFFDQMLSALPTAWSDLGNPKSPWDLGGEQKIFSIGAGEKGPEETPDGMEYPPYDESSLLASRLRQHQISGGDKPIGIQLNHPGQQHQQQLLFSGMGRSPGASDLMPLLPLGLGADDIIARSQDEAGREAMYNGYGAPIQQHFQNSQSYGGAPVGPPPAAAAGGGGVAVTAAAPRQRVRARRGQATDPHSIAERLRRERIAERMKALQELVPNANKTDKASMLDEIIDYVKFLQLQVKVLSMSRLGGAGAVAPLVADISSEAGRGGNAAAAAGSDSLAVTEHQVAKLMEEDMGTAMQYLQGKGLCLMPISLASAISTAGCTTRNSGGVAAALSGLLGGANPGLMLAPPASVGNNNGGAGGDGPTSPSMSVLTVQSAMANGGDASSAVKELGSVSKP